MSRKIIGLGGALSDSSTSLWALEIAMASAYDAGAEIEVFDLARLDLPMLDLRVKEVPDSVKQLCAVVAECDGMIWSSPLYHGTISGAFKNALDWLQELSTDDRPYLTDRAIGLICTAGGVQGLQAINTMEFVVRALRGFAVPMVVPVSNTWQAFDAEGNLTDSKCKEQLEQLGREVHRVSGALATLA